MVSFPGINVIMLLFTNIDVDLKNKIFVRPFGRLFHMLGNKNKNKIKFARGFGR